MKPDSDLTKYPFPKVFSIKKKMYLFPLRKTTTPPKTTNQSKTKNQNPANQPTKPCGFC